MSNNPQAAQMGDASMVRNLGHQAAAIWPHESAYFGRYQLRGELRVLDIGCGTGEITTRLSDLYPSASILGVDLLSSNLEIARSRTAAHFEAAGASSDVRYAEGDAFDLQLASGSFDLVVCRHLSQAVPDFPRALAEITRVLKPGGWLHLLSEDYGMIHMPHGSSAELGSSAQQAPSRSLDQFWVGTVLPYLERMGCDGRVGRHSLPLARQLGYEALRIDYIVVDTERVERWLFAAIFRAWKDGYAQPLADSSGRPLAEVAGCFDQMIRAIEDPQRYVVWQIPVVSGRRSSIAI